MQVLINNVKGRLETGRWWVIMAVMVVSVAEVMALNGPNVCVVEQKYNVTKRVKYRAPMAVRTYEWCFAVPPRCSRWTTEMRDLTRLENEERTAEVAVCCPGYKMQDISCVPICPHGKTGHGCSTDCPPNKWGPNCVHTCKHCSDQGVCSPITGKCQCQDGWQGERCEISLLISTSTTVLESLLTTTKTTTALTVPTTEAPTTKMVSIPTSTTEAPTHKTSLTSTVRQTAAEILTSTSTKKPKPTTWFTETEILSTRLEKTKSLYNNSTITTWPATTNVFKETMISYTPLETTSRRIKTHILSSPTDITEAPTTISIKGTPTAAKEMTTTQLVPTTKIIETAATTREATLKNRVETTQKPETTTKILPTTIKFKPKEIWIKPAQKGESPTVETKIKPSYEKPLLRFIKNTTSNDLLSTTTTPRTIIVSIIPTLMSYSTFKKISLTTSSSLNTQHYRSLGQRQNVTKSVSLLNHRTSTSIPFTIKILNAVTSRRNIFSSTVNPLLLENATNKSSTSQDTISTTPSVKSTKSVFSLSNTTNSMSGMKEVNKTNPSFHHFLSTTTSPVFSTEVSPKKSISFEISTFTKAIVTIPSTTKKLKSSSETTRVNTKTTSAHPSVGQHDVTVEQSKKASEINKTVDIVKDFITKHSPLIRKQNISDDAKNKVTQKPIEITSTAKPITANAKTNDVEFTSSTNTVTTETVEDEGSFDILTEPEHITAIIDDKSSKSTSLDLISVISIAGGVMMSVITVAVIIVMIERCRRPSYGEMRKVNDIRMKVVMGNNDEPPPYVRSIFHSPLPDPPITDKCHYQPISTLDRNLKQFMRPVVVQTISPLMLENFRGILECHYDHLPAQRRSHDFKASRCDNRCSMAPSMDTCSESLCPRSPSVCDSTIDALRCEAKLDVLDSTTSEPLYAEIPCWRPPSEHAIEIVNMNGEAVTEL